MTTIQKSYAPKPWAIILAAGSGSRLNYGRAAEDKLAPKQFIAYKDYPLYWHSALCMCKVASMQGIIFVFPKDHMDCATKAIKAFTLNKPLGLAYHVIAGGKRRQDSAFNALEFIHQHIQGCESVLIHDAARPFIKPALITKLCHTLSTEPDVHGVIPALPVYDTIKFVDQDVVNSTPDRQKLKAIQTPQLFIFKSLFNAHQQAVQNAWTVTDDASILEKCNLKVMTIEGQIDNIKITTYQDLKKLEPAPMPLISCTGYGYDVHKYGQGRPLILGGVLIPGAPQIIAHSDGDVLLHAIMDALLGCACLGDIGLHFPDTSKDYDNISSAILLEKVLHLIDQVQVKPIQLDLTIICQIPKIKPHKNGIQKNISRLLRLDKKYINVKATTEEGLGFTGAKEGIKAVALITALRKMNDT